LADALVVQKQGTGFHVHRSPRTTSTVEPYSQLPFQAHRPAVRIPHNSLRHTSISPYSPISRTRDNRQQSHHQIALSNLQTRLKTRRDIHIHWIGRDHHSYHCPFWFVPYSQFPIPNSLVQGPALRSWWLASPSPAIPINLIRELSRVKLDETYQCSPPVAVLRACLRRTKVTKYSSFLPP